MSCKVATTTKEFFKKRNILDDNLNILDLSKFRNEVKKWTDFAKSKFNVDEGAIYSEENGGKKAIPNYKAFAKIDGIKTYNEKVKDNIAKEDLNNQLETKIEEEMQLGITPEGESNTNIEELYQKAMKLSGEYIENKLNECL